MHILCLLLLPSILVRRTVATTMVVGEAMAAEVVRPPAGALLL